MRRNKRTEKFEEAVAEYQSALNIEKELLKPFDRRIASTHLMIALTLEYAPGESNIAKSLEHAGLAKEVLKLKLSNLQELETKSKEDEGEIKDIEEVIVDLDEKVGHLLSRTNRCDVEKKYDQQIEDLKLAPQIAEETEKDKKLNELLGSTLLPSDTPVTDLGSLGLVKKKKPPATTPSTSNGSSSNDKRKAEESESSENPNKKSKLQTVIEPATP